MPPFTLTLIAGPLAGKPWDPPRRPGEPGISGWPWPVPPEVVTLTLDASGRVVDLRPDEELLVFVGHREKGGGLGWATYRRAEQSVPLASGPCWPYTWAPAQDPGRSR
jgi:hypothetical protein